MGQKVEIINFYMMIYYGESDTEQRGWWRILNL
jgi:hypothetical protein